jgi:intracellular multiplication protein IcmL
MVEVAKKPENTKTEDAAVNAPLMSVVVRNEFYRDGFRNMMRIAIAEAVIIVVLIVTFIAYMNSTKPQNFYFATTADGRIMQLVPLDRANMGTSALMSWVSQSATEIMTFGFHDYQRRMQQSSRHFTRQGWESFTAALQKSRIMESVEASQQVVTAQPRSAPVLVQEGVFNGKYRWVVDLPLTVTYQSGSASRADNLMIRLVIDRVPSLESPNGVGIEQWIATQS